MDDRRTVSRLISRLDEISQRGTVGTDPDSLRAIDRSFLGTSVIGVSRVLLGRFNDLTNFRSAADSVRELRRLLSNKRIREHSLFPFDERRFSQMRSMLDFDYRRL